MTTQPGFSSRNTGITFQPFPQRDEADMQQLSEPVEPTVNGMDGDGWSNSDAVEGAPKDVQPEINVQLTPAGPGWSNAAPSPEAAAEATVTPEPAAEPVKTATRRAAKKG